MKIEVSKIEWLEAPQALICFVSSFVFPVDADLTKEEHKEHVDGFVSILNGYEQEYNPNNKIESVEWEYVSVEDVIEANNEIAANNARIAELEEIVDSNIDLIQAALVSAKVRKAEAETFMAFVDKVLA